jgi:hypothetical protein
VESTTATLTGVATQTRTQESRTAPTASGGVLGAIVALKSPAKPKATGGVLGTTTRLGATITQHHLPFTGLSLGLFAALAAGLIFVGFAARRASGNRT